MPDFPFGKRDKDRFGGLLNKQGISFSANFEVSDDEVVYFIIKKTYNGIYAVYKAQSKFGEGEVSEKVFDEIYFGTNRNDAIEEWVDAIEFFA